MVKLIASAVVRGSDQDPGGVCTIDIEKQAVQRLLDWNTLDIDWQQHGAGGGIAVDGETVYLLAGDALHAFTPDFKLIGSWRNRYLRYAGELSIFSGMLYVVSAGYDSILGFDLDKKQFAWGLHIDLDRFNYSGSIYDPMGDEGPLLLDKLHLNNVHANENGMYISGAGTEGMLHFNGEAVYMSVTLPLGIHNAQPFRDGVLFHDCEAGAVRYASRSGEEDRAISLAQPGGPGNGAGDDGPAVSVRQDSGRGLCPINDRIVAAGFSPSTVAVYDLRESETLLSVNLSRDTNSTILGLEVWPF